MAARIVRLGSGEGTRWRSIRLQALAESPQAFGTTYAEAAQWDVSRWEAPVVEFATFIAIAGDSDSKVFRAPVLPADRDDMRTANPFPAARATIST